MPVSSSNRFVSAGKGHGWIVFYRGHDVAFRLAEQSGHQCRCLKGEVPGTVDRQVLVGLDLQVGHGALSSGVAVLLNLFIRRGDALLAVLFSEADDLTLGRQVAFYTPLLQFGKVVFGGNAVFLLYFPVSHTQ